jgi:tripeptide aminopeptidase
MDTVPICVGCRPKRQGNLITSAAKNTGLGADNRAGVAVILSAATRILRHELAHPPLTFVWTVQEEVGLYGARLLKIGSLGAPKLAFNWDGGSASRVTIGATGGYRMEIHIRGQASHAGGAPEKGISAIAIAGLAIADLQRNGWHGKIQKDGRMGTSNIGVIEGGNATNVVADQVRIRAEARSHDPEFRQTIVREMENSFRSAVTHVPNVDDQVGSVDIDGRLDYESFCLKSTEPCVVAAEAAVSAVGREPELVVSNGGLDANWLSARGIPTVTLGCGQLNPHMTSEALDVAEFQAACRIALLLATAAEQVEHGAG